jgi:hypothetical protein
MINIEEYKKLRELLHASDEDYEVACENIKNIKLSPVTMKMLAKSLMFGRRQNFCEKFDIDYYTIKEWNQIFKDVNNITISTDKDIVEWEVHQQMIPVFKKTWSFVKDVKLKLNWNGHTG